MYGPIQRYKNTYGRDIHVDSGGYPKTRSLILSLQIVLVTLFILCLDPMRKLLYQRQQSVVGKRSIKKVGKYDVIFQNLILVRSWALGKINKIEELVRDRDLIGHNLSYLICVSVSYHAVQYCVLLVLLVQYIKCIMQQLSALSSVRLQSLLVEPNPSVGVSRKHSLRQEPCYLCTNVNEVFSMKLRLVCYKIDFGQLIILLMVPYSSVDIHCNCIIVHN